MITLNELTLSGCCALFVKQVDGGLGQCYYCHYDEDDEFIMNVIFIFSQCRCSEALLALPTLTGFKQEAPSPPNIDHGYFHIPSESFANLSSISFWNLKLSNSFNKISSVLENVISYYFISVDLFPRYDSNFPVFFFSLLIFLFPFQKSS